MPRFPVPRFQAFARLRLPHYYIASIDNHARLQRRFSHLGKETGKIVANTRRVIPQGTTIDLESRPIEMEFFLQSFSQ